MDLLLKDTETSGSERNTLLTRFAKGFGWCYIVFNFVFILTGIVLWVAKLAIGFKYLNECGLTTFLILDALCSTFFFKYEFCGDTEEVGKCMKIFSLCRRVFIGLFQVAWLVYGTVKVVDVRNSIQAPGNCKHSTGTIGKTCVTCNDVLVDFTFATAILEWIFVGLFLIFKALSSYLLPLL